MNILIFWVIGSHTYPFDGFMEMFRLAREPLRYPSLIIATVMLEPSICISGLRYFF